VYSTTLSWRRQTSIKANQQQRQQLWQSPRAAATRETYKTLEIGTASDAHLVSSLLTKLIQSLEVGGALLINHNFLDGTDLLSFQNTVPGMISLGRQVLKSINWSLLLLLSILLFIFHYYSIHYKKFLHYYFFIIIIFCSSGFFYHYNYFIRYLVEIVQE